MSRLPQPGADSGIWGTILNDFLGVEHNPDGTLRLRSDGTFYAKPASGIPASDFSSSVQATLTNQRTPLDGSVTNAKVASGAAIDPAKIAGTAEVQSNKGQVNGYATLNSSGKIPTTQLGGNSANSTTFLRGDQTWIAVPAPTDATTASKGIVQLAGDLGGSAALPTVPALTTKVDKNTIVHNVKDYGAVGDGITDDTAAITLALADGGVTFFPVGTYIHTGLTLTSGAHLCGVGAGGYVKNYAPANQQPVPQQARSALKLKAAANADCITIPAGVALGVIEFLEIDGNKTNQTGSTGYGINLPNAANAEEAQWKFNRIYVHDTVTSGLYIGSNQQGCSTFQSVYFQCGLSDTTGGSGIVISGTDTTVDTCLIGVSWSDSIKIQSSVNRIISTEVFSNITTASGAGAGIAIADGLGCSRNVIANCTIDRCAGHGLYVGTSSIGNLINGNVFHSNSQKTNGTYYHMDMKESANLFIGNQIYHNDPSASSNKPNYAVFVASGKSLYGKNLNYVDSAAYNTAAINDGTLIVTPNL